jgi:hypothetical protein
MTESTYLYSDNPLSCFIVPRLLPEQTAYPSRCLYLPSILDDLGFPLLRYIRHFIWVRPSEEGGNGRELRGG